MLNIDKSDFGTGLAIGAVLGGLAALLLAPKSGQKVRRYIREKAADGVEVLRELGDDEKLLR